MFVYVYCLYCCVRRGQGYCQIDGVLVVFEVEKIVVWGYWGYVGEEYCSVGIQMVWVEDFIGGGDFQFVVCE